MKLRLLSCRRLMGGQYQATERMSGMTNTDEDRRLGIRVRIAVEEGRAPCTGRDREKEGKEGSRMPTSQIAKKVMRVRDLDGA